MSRVPATSGVGLIWAGLVSLIAVCLCLWQDGDNVCNDGERYTSGKSQPYPFHRRWCGWPKPILKAASVVGLVALGTMMGTPQKALLFCSLPGFWFVAVHRTCVDAVSMALGLGASLLFPFQPYFSVLLAILSGVVHERGPVFAALYAGSPLLLLGLVGVGWWRRAAMPDSDRLVGKGLVHAIRAHKPYTDWLDWKVSLFAARAVPLLAAFYGVSPRAWLALALAWASRVVGTDGARFIWWGTPLLIRELPSDLPWWAVLLHVLTFRRMIGILILLGAARYSVSTFVA